MNSGCATLDQSRSNGVGGRGERNNGKCERPYTVEDVCCGTGQVQPFVNIIE